MIAVDTNVVVRLLVADDPIQGPVARRLFEENDIAIPHTVLLETEWVLRSTYRLARGRIGASLLGLLGIPTVSCPSKEAVVNAIGAMAAGCDFADALHAATADRRVSEFVTFDADFNRRATGMSGLPPVRLLGTTSA